MMAISKIGICYRLGLRKSARAPGRLLSLPLPGIRTHPLLRIHSQSVCHAIDIIEIAYHLHSNGNCFLAESLLPQSHNIILSDRTRGKRKFRRIITESPIGRREIHCPVIEDQLLRPGFIPGFATELGRMGERSVIAIVNITHDRRQHLTTGRRKPVG